MTTNLGYKFNDPRSLEKLGRIISALAEPKTRTELCDIIGVSLRSVHPYLNHLMAADNRRIHICGWRRNSPGSPSPLYLVGDMPDKKRPRPATNAEILRRRRKDPEVRLSEGKQRQAKRIKPYRDPLTAALFGQA